MESQNSSHNGKDLPLTASTPRHRAESTEKPEHARREETEYSGRHDSRLRRDADGSDSGQPEGRLRRHPAIPDLMSFGVLVLSVALIIWLSIDMTDGVDLVEDHNYITFQFWVCIFFITDFFVELAYSDNKGRYFLRRLIFLLLSIPYLNIFQICQVPMSHEVLCFLRFAPIARGALALAFVMGYLSKNALTSMFISYLAIMVLVGYFCSLIFYEQETAVNPQVQNYWSALWWTAMNMTTVGCDIQPVTVAGKIVAVIVPVCGMIVFPLFTVYLSNYVTRMVKKVRGN